MDVRKRTLRVVEKNDYLIQLVIFASTPYMRGNRRQESLKLPFPTAN